MVCVLFSSYFVKEINIHTEDLASPVTFDLDSQQWFLFCNLICAWLSLYFHVSKLSLCSDIATLHTLRIAVVRSSQCKTRLYLLMKDLGRLYQTINYILWDEILNNRVIAKGQIQEEGSHEELLGRGGMYSNLVQRQLTKAVSHSPSMARISSFSRID